MEKKMNLFMLFLFYLVGKPIKINIMNVFAKYYVSELRTQKTWDGVETIEVTLKTVDSLKIK
jgi:hypothetical protein